MSAILLLNVSQMPGQGGLSDVQILSGGGQRTGIRDGNKDLQVLKIHMITILVLYLNR